MDPIELFERLALALSIGLLIGLERGWQARDEHEGERSLGLRTLALVGLLGGVCGAIARELGPAGGAGILLGLGFAVAGGTLVLFRYRETRHDGTFGATSAVAALLAFALGVLAVLGNMAAAAASGVAVAGLLALKAALHAWLRRLTWGELRSVLVLLAMSFILLPVLPRQPIDPLGALNPYELWLLTVMIGVISFAGYVAIKLTGTRRGIALTGLAAGLASSTAATLSLGRLAREHPEQAALMAGGALIAGATMMLRVLVIAAVVKAALLEHLLAPLALAATLSAAAGLLLVAHRTSGDGGEAELPLANPLDLATVLQFGALLAAIGVLTRIATRLGGNAGAYALAMISGLADVDAITLSMGRLADATLSLEAAATAILLAVAVNTVTKAVLAWSTGGRAYGRWLALVALAAICAGLLALWLGPLPLARHGLGLGA